MKIIARATVFTLVAGLLVASPHAPQPLLAQTASSAAGPAASAAADVDPRIGALLKQISEARMRQLMEKLVSFGTRNTLSSADSTTRGIGAARQWIFDEMQRSSKRLQVSFDTHQIPQGGRITRPVELRNVIAVLPGKSPRRIYISGHYDSLNLAQTRGGNVSQEVSAQRGPGQAAAQPAASAQPASGQTASGQTASASPAAPQPASNQTASNQAGSNQSAGSATAGQPGANAAPANYDIDAPGANDDGSGTVLAMELARVFGESGIEFDATLVFAALAGEEQGLIGARAHAEQAKKDNVTIQAILNNDIVGNATSGSGLVDSQSIRLYSESPEDSPSRAIARFVVRQGARYVPSHHVRPMARQDRFGRGGDHSAFTQVGFPGVVFRESRENFSKQHGAGDTIDGVSFAYLAQNARVNAAAAAVMALAPPSPVVLSAGQNGRGPGLPTLGRQPSGYDATLRWQAVPGAVAYRIFWRDAWTLDWEHEMTIGGATEFTLPNMSIDDYVFGVAAIGPGGHESPIAAYVYPPRQDPAR